MLSLWNPLLFEVLKPKKSFNRDLFDDIDLFFASGLEHKVNEDASLSVSIDLPGVSEEDVAVEVKDNNILSIKAERKTSLSSYKINKSFSVPEMYDADKIIAELKNGVLILTLPSKNKEAKEPKKVVVNSVK